MHSAHGHISYSIVARMCDVECFLLLLLLCTIYQIDRHSKYVESNDYACGYGSIFGTEREMSKRNDRMRCQKEEKKRVNAHFLCKHNYQCFFFVRVASKDKLKYFITRHIVANLCWCGFCDNLLSQHKEKERKTAIITTTTPSMAKEFPHSAKQYLRASENFLFFRCKCKLILENARFSYTLYTSIVFLKCP